MRDAFILGTLDKHRGRLLQLVEKCPEDKRNVVPDGFNNSIHWQIGHVLSITERVVYGFTELTPVLPAHYKAFFGGGTKPADWQEEPPAWEVLVDQLKEQPNHIRELLKDKLEESVKENFLKAETVGEVILSSVLHEVNHYGNISSMLRLL